MSAKDLLKMHQVQVLNQKSEKKNSLASTPRLGIGCLPGQDIDLSLAFLSTQLKPVNRAEIAKVCDLFCRKNTTTPSIRIQNTVLDTSR